MLMLNELNVQQKKIVKDDHGIIIINAGPGTGKTKTLISRIDYLITHKQVNPQNILTLTFTKRAAAEMEERLKNTLKSSNQLPKVTTFHGWAFECLTSLGQEIRIISEEDQELLLKKVIKEGGSKLSWRDLSLIISQHKSTTTPVQKDQQTEILLKNYQKNLEEQGLYDFDDLLLLTWELLINDSNLRNKLNKQHRHILIDEFQDTNDLQYQIIKLILNEHSTLFVIGDPYQSIYQFRGGSPKIFDQLKNDFISFYEETLQINYRSCTSIVQTGNLLFPEVLNLQSNTVEKGKVTIIQTLNEYSEAEWIVNFISQKIGGIDLIEASESLAAFDDFAVIYRTHNLANVLTKKFEESGMPYQIVREDIPMEGDHIKLLSMHAAKGLEFKYVFICGFEEGLVPFIKNEEDFEEEKRLLYVALTRAKEELFLISARKRHGKPSQTSQFKKLLKHSDILEIEDEATAKTLKKRQMSLL